MGFNAFFAYLCQNTNVSKFSATITLLALTMPAYSAGLGFNPFERNSPSSPTGNARPSPASPSQVSPAAAPKSSPAPVAIPAKPEPPQPPKSGANQTKK